MTRTKFSLQINPYNDVPDDDTALIDGIIDDAIRADQAGMAAVYITEHHGNHPGSSFVLAAYLARALEQAHLGFCICTVPYHHPQRLAEMANLLDQLTKGRFVFGIGGGGLPLDSATVGIHAADCTQLHDDVFDVVMQLWDKQPEDEPIRYEVGPYSGELIQRVVPRAYGHDRPHVKLAGLGPRMGKAARYGWSIFSMPAAVVGYRALLEAEGHPPDVVERAMEWTSASAIVHIAPTDDQAREWALQGQQMRAAKLDHHFALTDQYLGWMRQRAMPQFAPGAGPNLGGDGEVSSRTVWGSPETVIEKLKDTVDLGIPEISIGFDNGAMEAPLWEHTHESVRLFCGEVLPYFAEYEPDLDRGRELLAAMPVGPFGPPPSADDGVSAS